jgi:uncharacterized protein YndB with AHSA1/START domain
MNFVKSITITRVFDAPRKLVFEAWLDEKHLQQWWMPRGFTNPTCRITSGKRRTDAIHGGGEIGDLLSLKTPGRAESGAELTVTTYHPDFGEMPQSGKYEEVLPFDKIVFTTTAFHDSQGKPKLRGHNVVLFSDEGSKTKMVITASILEAGPGLEGALAGMDQGWSETLDRLAEHVEDTSDREFGAKRTVDAPRELVWSCFTEPQHIKEWWGPNGFTNTIHKMDVTQGGEWLLTMHGPDGVDYPNKIKYIEVIKPEKLVYDHGTPSDEFGYFRAFVNLTDLREKTEISMRGVFKTKAERDVVVEKYGAIEGQQQTLARLADYAAKLNEK